MILIKKLFLRLSRQSYLFAFILLNVFLSQSATYGQNKNDEFESNLSKGKELFFEGERDFDNDKIMQSVKYFTKGLSLDSSSLKNRYFLGYAISRLNKPNLEAIPLQQEELTRLSSLQFESIIKSGLEQKEEFYYASPHTKIMLEWGVLGFKYLALNKPDSVIWAFNEARQRGSFSEYLLNSNRFYECFQ